MPFLISYAVIEHCAVLQSVSPCRVDERRGWQARGFFGSHVPPFPFSSKLAPLFVMRRLIFLIKMEGRFRWQKTALPKIAISEVTTSAVQG